MSRNYIGLIIPFWKFDVLKTIKNINFQWGNYQPIVPRQKHSIVLLGRVMSYDKEMSRTLQIPWRLIKFIQFFMSLVVSSSNLPFITSHRLIAC